MPQEGPAQSCSQSFILSCHNIPQILLKWAFNTNQSNIILSSLAEKQLFFIKKNSVVTSVIVRKGEGQLIDICYM